MKHPTIVNHLVVSNTSIALSENCGSIISMWDKGIKSSVVLPPRHAVDRLGFLSPSSLGAVITREASPPLFSRITSFVGGFGRCDTTPLSSSVIHMAPVPGTDRVVIAHRSGTIQIIPEDNCTEHVSSGFSSACGSDDGLVCAATFDGRVVVWDTARGDLRRVSTLDTGRASPVNHMACARRGGRVLVVSTCFGRESEVILSVLTGKNLTSCTIMRGPATLDSDGICSMRIEGDDVFVLDGTGAIHHFSLSHPARYTQRFVFPEARVGLIDNIAVTRNFLIHNEGSRVHVWARRKNGIDAPPPPPPPASARMLPAPAGNPIIQQWLEAQAMILSDNTTQN
jgi:hypothetical protein